MIKTVGVVGAGTMGNGIAQVFAQSGFTVRLHDSAAGALDRARATVEKSLAKFVEKGKLTTADRDASLGRLTAAPAIDALGDADYVVEAIVERLDAKRQIFATLDALTRPDVILTSNTSSISITALGAATKRPDRVLGMTRVRAIGHRASAATRPARIAACVASARRLSRATPATAHPVAMPASP